MQFSVSLGLAWTAMGGEIMFVEATRMGGEGKITLTGQLGKLITYWLLFEPQRRKQNGLMRFNAPKMQLKYHMVRHPAR